MSFDEFQTRVAVVGVGGQGCNLVTRLYRAGLKSADTIAVNTDQTHLSITNAHKKLLIGKEITRGLGAGGFPQVAMKAAEVSKEDIANALQGYNLIFLAAGMGGGTGTGAAPIVARIAKEQGALVIATVTYPFSLERNRKNTADWGINELNKTADLTLVVENERLLSYASNLPMEKAFEVADNIIGESIKAISDSISIPSFMNIDFSDLRNIVGGSGMGVIGVGTGTGSGPERIEEAIRSTREHPLVAADYTGAKGALIHITAGPNLTIQETNQIGEGVTEGLAPNANVIMGARIVPEFENKIKVLSIITGVKTKVGEIVSRVNASSNWNLGIVESIY